MRHAGAALIALAFLAGGCGPDPGQVDLGGAERSWARALRGAREAGWPYPKIGKIRDTIEKCPGDRRALCDITYDLADTRTNDDGAVAVVDACAASLVAGSDGDPLAASMQLCARAGYEPDMMVQTARLFAAAHAAGLDLKDLVRVVDRASVFKTPGWTVLQFLKEITESAGDVPLSSQVSLFEEALGHKGRHIEAQAVLAAFREAVRGGLPAGDLSAACRLKLRRGMPPSRMAGWLKEIAQWPVPPLGRPDALRLIAAGEAHGLPDEEVAALGGFVARSAMDTPDAAVLAARLEANIRAGLRGRKLLAQTLESFSGARPSAPAPR